MGIKKIIGTGVFAVALVAGFLGFSGKASGLFQYIGSDLKATGQVQTTNVNSFELVTSGGTLPSTIIVNSSTTYSGGYTNLGDVKAGDEVHVVANRTTGDFVALEVNKVPAPDLYGNAACDSFVLSTAVFERPVGNFFYASRDNTKVRVNFDSTTQVSGGTFNDLLPGTELIVEGLDCRSNGTLNAKKITIIDNDGLAMCNSHGPNSIVVRNRSVLLANDPASAQTGQIPVNVPAGQYKVYGVSFDNHSNTPWDKEKNERWRVRGFSEDSKVFVTKATKDLPNNVDFNQTKLTTTRLNKPLDSIQMVHKGPIGQGYESVYPICVVFEPTGQTSNNSSNQDEPALVEPEDELDD